MKRTIKIFVFIFIMILANKVIAGVPALDTSFSNGSGFSNVIRAVTVQPDDKILVGGGFGSYNGTTVNRIVRLNVNGLRDESFNTGTGFNGTVFSNIVLQPDGKVIIGGNFSTFNGATSSMIARINTDGSRDESFITGTGFTYYVNYLRLQPDGKILAGGEFSTYNGASITRIARLNTDGTLDETFNPGLGVNALVRAIDVQADGKILVGGNFTSCNGVAMGHIVRLNTDGSIDTSFNSGGAGFNGNVPAIFVQPDQKIVVGGGFTTYNGLTTNDIVRLNTDGSIDSSFNTGTGQNAYTSLLYIYPDGKILATGGFTTYNGANSKYIVRLNSDGSPETLFNTDAGFDSTINGFGVQSDGKIVFGGYFGKYNNISTGYIARLSINSAPGAPTGVGATASNTEAILSWSAPTDSGSTAIAYYNIYNSATNLAIASTTNTTKNISGLSNAVEYGYYITAINSIGESASSTVVLVTPGTVPDAPTINSVIASSRKVVIDFTTPNSNGSNIINYFALSSPDNIGSYGTVTPITIENLVNGVSYWFNVFAINTFGTSTASASSTKVTPHGSSRKIVSTPASSNTQTATPTTQAPVTENSTPIETVTATTTFNISTSTETTSTTTKPILATTTVKEDIVAKPTTVETPTETPKVTYTITPETLTTITKQDLKSGQQTPEVELLQQFLNANGFIISQTGPGSPGHETTYFGKATKSALAKYQKSVGLPATGYFGPMTRAKILNN